MAASPGGPRIRPDGIYGQESRYDLPYIYPRLAQEADGGIGAELSVLAIGGLAIGGLAIGGLAIHGLPTRGPRRGPVAPRRPARTALYCIAWAAIAAVTAWGITIARSSAAISRLKAEMRQEIAYWQAETSRARTVATQLARDAATRATAWREGRDNVISIMPLIAAARDGSTCSPRAEDGTGTT